MSIFGTPAKHNANVTASDTLSLTSAVAAGNLLILAVISQNVPDDLPLQDDLGNTYILAGAPSTSQSGTVTSLWYVLSSIGDSAAATLEIDWLESQSFAAVYQWVVPLTGGFATFDTQSYGASASNGTAASTPTFNTIGTDEIVFAAEGSSLNHSLTTPWTNKAGWASDSRGFGVASHLVCGSQHVLETSPQTNLAPTATLVSSGDWSMGALAFYGTALAMYSVSGNCGRPGAAVSYSIGSATTSGFVTADGSGNYTIPNLFTTVTYRIWPSASGYAFSGNSGNYSTITIPAGDTTGFNFTASTINYAASFSDNFTRANENPLSDAGAWVPTGAGNVNLQVSGNECIATGASGTSFAAQNLAAPATVAEYLTATIQSMDFGAGSNTGLVFVQNSGFNSEFGVEVDVSGTNVTYSLTNTTGTKKGATTPAAFVPGTVMRLEWFQSKLDAYVNGAFIFSLLNQATATATGFFPGIFMVGAGSPGDIAYTYLETGTITQPPSTLPGGFLMGSVIFDLDSEGFVIPECQIGTQV